MSSSDYTVQTLELRLKCQSLDNIKNMFLKNQLLRSDKMKKNVLKRLADQISGFLSDQLIRSALIDLNAVY